MKLLVDEYFNRFWLALAALLLVLALSTGVQAADVKRTIWQSRDQFVSLVNQDNAVAGLNDHPVELAPERLSAMLASIKVRKGDDEKPSQLLTSGALQALVPHLRQALRQAAPDEDAVFAIFGLHEALYGLAKSPRVTTGRVFYKGGKLNLVVGMVQQDVDERADRRLSPFIPGSRQKVAEGSWSLSPAASLLRRDWVAFGEEWQPQAEPAPVRENTGVQRPEAVAQPVMQPDGVRNPAERLIVLKDLRDKGLISEDEYRTKRQQILDGL